MRAVILALLSALLLVQATPASAQENGLGGSFLTPFPENDTYQVQVVGDWLADGLMGGLAEAFATGPGVVVSKKRYDLPALMLNRTDADLGALEQAFATTRATSPSSCSAPRTATTWARGAHWVSRATGATTTLPASTAR